MRTQSQIRATKTNLLRNISSIAYYPRYEQISASTIKNKYKIFTAFLSNKRTMFLKYIFLSIASYLSEQIVIREAKNLMHSVIAIRDSKIKLTKLRFEDRTRLEKITSAVQEAKGSRHNGYPIE